jgi:hypothetical protein
MKIGTFYARKTILCVRVGKLGCSVWSVHPTPYDGWVAMDAAGVVVGRPTPESGYPALLADLGWRGVRISVKGVETGGDRQ